MKAIRSILGDPRIYVPVLFLALFELFMQTGLYKHLLQPRSYADNVNRILRLAGTTRDPSALILGTSVAYQGIQVPYLNQLLEKDGIVVESGACEGARLETQHLIMRNLLTHMPNVKTIIHFVEASHPATARDHMDLANRSMVAQFPRSETLYVLHGHNYQLSYSDYLFFYIRTLTYQKDFRDFVLDPLDRFKGIGRRHRELNTGIVYENKYDYKLSAFPATNAKECVEAALKADIAKMGKDVTDEHHRRAVLQTCNIVVQDPLNGPGHAQWSSLYFDRLKFTYKDITDRGIKVIVVFAPYAQIIQDLNAEYRMKVWNDGLAGAITPENLNTVDLRHSLDGPKNSDYYYDTIHLNRQGATLLTQALADKIRPILKAK
ncbi:MAG: hypothetical protein K8S54_06660 [Spirochaetia bacterium]|nr:hypothetical protein [Spirochaetia bacterium]